MQTYYETNRLILKVLSPDWCHEVLRFYQENHSIFQPFDPLMPQGYFTSQYQYNTLSYEYHAYMEHKMVRFYLFEKKNPKHIIGTISFGGILQGFLKCATLGYKLEKDFQHQGYAFEALQKGIEIMFFEEQLHRLNAYIMSTNIPSLRLIKRLYFTYEGISREYAFINGRWEDHEIYSLINHP